MKWCSNKNKVEWRVSASQYEKRNVMCKDGGVEIVYKVMPHLYSVSHSHQCHDAASNKLVASGSNYKIQLQIM